MCDRVVLQWIICSYNNIVHDNVGFIIQPKVGTQKYIHNNNNHKVDNEHTFEEKKHHQYRHHNIIIDFRDINM